MTSNYASQNITNSIFLGIQTIPETPDKMALEFSDYNIMNFRHFSYSKSIFSKQNSNIVLIRNV